MLLKLGREGEALLWPPRCPICHEVIPREMKIHPGCFEQIPFVREPVCMCCGRTVLDEGEEYCPDCRERSHDFEGGTALMFYSRKVQDSLVRFKYHGAREYGAFYADELCRRWKEKLLVYSPEVLIPVPVHAARLRERGYNQAEVLAQELGKRLDLPVDASLLVRVKKTTPQKTFSDIERRRNLMEAFALTRRVEARSVLLVDDIYTTGATLDACSRILLEGGAGHVSTVCAAIGGRL